MSNHKIGFYEDLTNIIFQLSINIIKYTPYLCFCGIHCTRSVCACMCLLDNQGSSQSLLASKAKSLWDWHAADHYY